MKKNYFLRTWILFVALITVSVVNAETPITELYGTYKFTADVAMVDADYTSHWSKDCEVVITKDAANIFLAQIQNFAGAKGSEYQKVSRWKDNAMVIINPNGNYGIFTGGLYMANANGDYPFGDSSYNTISYTWDAAAQTLSVPDFTFVTCDFATEKATIRVKFTNVKMVMIEQEVNVPNITGKWNYINGTGEHDSDSTSQMSPDFTFDMVQPNPSKPKEWTGTFHFDMFNSITLSGTFNGTTLTFPFDNTVLGDYGTVLFRLADYNTQSPTGSIVFNYLSETSMSLAGGILVQQVKNDATTTYQWMQAGTATLEEETFTWDGTYKITAEIGYNADGGTYPTEWDMTVVYNETTSKYYVTHFWGEDITALNQGGLPLTPNEGNPKEATINLGFLKMIERGKTYYVLRDQEAKSNPITIKLNDDGTVSIADFCVSTLDFTTNEETLNVFYNAVAGTFKEPSVIGKWKVTATLAEGDPDVYPTEFRMEIIESYGYTLITTFLGNDIAALNSGGIAVTQSETDYTGTVANGYLKTIIKGELYLKLYDENLTATPIGFTISKDGNTITFDNFTVVEINFGGSADPILKARYESVTATRISDDEYIELGVDDIKVTDPDDNMIDPNKPMKIYNIMGVEQPKINGNGIYIIKQGKNTQKVFINNK